MVTRILPLNESVRVAMASRENQPGVSHFCSAPASGLCRTAFLDVAGVLNR
jgi:hypothetical protein